ncbi:MAG: 4Fe-4S binding protein [Elusimicrobia bacterium]|nr:4Fe-4S binding protein [Elusimicrobiota bacterium]
MASRIRLLTRTAFLLLSLSVFFGVVADRRVVAAYNSLHLFPTLASLPWFALPPLGRFSLAAAGTLILVSLLFGRVYCSFLCPAGFIQDLARRLGRALGLAGRPAPGWMGPRLFILALSLALLAARSSAYHYLDHFSNLGRLYGAAAALYRAGPYGWGFWLGSLFAAGIILTSLRWPRWFCGAVCPSGTLFMLMQAVAPGKVRNGGCAQDCGKCGSACPLQCVAGGRIDARLCNNCLECAAACPRGSLAFSWRRPWSAPRGRGPRGDGFGMTRRELLSVAGLSLAGAAAGWPIKRRLAAQDRALVVVPPGGKGYQTFMERCAACGACASVCPTKVLTQAGRGGDPAKPQLDFDSGYCAYECNACLGVCPSGAISYFPIEAKRLVRIGVSRLRKELCISYAFERDCGGCQEACPTGAITMEPSGSVYVPVLHEARCIGCGACQFACPVRPRKAITVAPVAIHSFAAAPLQSMELPPAAAQSSGFPF